MVLDLNEDTVSSPSFPSAVGKDTIAQLLGGTSLQPQLVGRQRAIQLLFITQNN